jgi:GcrA cell cycle regulator
MTHYHYVPPNNWTEARTEQLRALCAEGLSAGQIAAKIGNITRNGVIGKARRMGFGFVASPGGRPRRGRKPKARTHPFVERKTASFPSAPAFNQPPEPVANPVTLLNLEWWHCRWPVDRPPGPMMYCGALAVDGKPYCPKHCSDAFHMPLVLSAEERERRRRHFMKVAKPVAASHVPPPISDEYR